MNKKDAYWFKHDSTSGRGLRLKKIQHLYKHWGKGVYWDVIEVLREQTGYKYECDPLGLQMLGELIGVDDADKFVKWFNDCVQIQLFKKRGKFFYSEALLNNMKNWNSKKTNGSKGGRPKKATKKNRNESEVKTETKANQKDKRREEEKREEKKYLFKINDQGFEVKVSEYFTRNNQPFFEVWQMKNGNTISGTVLEKMDTDYHGYTFTDNNHVQNAFKKTWDKVKNSKNEPVTSTVKRHQPT